MKKSERAKTWDIVIVSRDVWSEVRRRRHFLAEEWSKERRVLFVEPPVSIPGMISGRPDAPMRDAETVSFRPKPPRAVSQSIHVFTPVRHIPESIPGGHAVCMSLMALQVRAAIRSLSLGSPVLWITPEYGVHLLHGVPHIFAVYDVTDDWTTASIPEKQRRRIEADDHRLLSLADMVFTVSTRLHKQKSARRPDAVLMPNGVIPEMYDIPTPPEPPELRGVARPIAGYTGTLHEDRIDVDLVLELSSRAKDGLSFVFIGPNLLGEKAAAALASRSNIRLISAQPFFRLPDFIAHFDTCIIPHALTPFTHSLDPIKAYEYLASGKPIVSTPVEGILPLSDHVDVAEGAEEFMAAILRAIEGRTKTSPDERRAVARANTWGDRAAEITAMIDSALERRRI